jgi:hypothetical protein
MLAEKFFLVLEALIRGGQTYPDGAPPECQHGPPRPAQAAPPGLNLAHAGVE